MHFGLYIRAVSITDNLCNKERNSSIYEPKIRGYRIPSDFKSRAGYNGMRTVDRSIELGKMPKDDLI